MATVFLNQGNNGKTVMLRLGDEVVLQLPENATTGYRWHVDRAEGLVEEEASPSESSAPSSSSSPDEENPVMGRGGQREFRFRTTEVGKGHLAVKYYRQWEGESSALDSFAVDLDVAS